MSENVGTSFILRGNHEFMDGPLFIGSMERSRRAESDRILNFCKLTEAAGISSQVNSPSVRERRYERRTRLHTYGESTPAGG